MHYRKKRNYNKKYMEKHNAFLGGSIRLYRPQIWMAHTHFSRKYVPAFLFKCTGEKTP